MTFTLITICLNSAGTVERCVDSVLAQTRLPDEYLFVDGGSTDGTLEILETLSSRLRERGVRSRVIRQIRKPGEAGIPSAWNQGIAASSGDIVALLNSDDWYEPTAIETVMDRFGKNPDMELLCGSVRMVSRDGRPQKLLHPQCLCLAHVLMPLKHPACFVSRKLYKRIGMYDTAFRISADYEFAWRCRAGLASVVYMDDCLVNMEAGGLANSSRAQARNETLRIARMYVPYSPFPYLAWLLRFLTGR